MLYKGSKYYKLGSGKIYLGAPVGNIVSTDKAKQTCIYLFIYSNG